MNKDRIIWWHTSTGGVQFARDVNKNVQLFTEAEANDTVKNNSTMHVEVIGAVAAGWVKA